jgi:hypothetical protein
LFLPNSSFDPKENPEVMTSGAVTRVSSNQCCKKIARRLESSGLQTRDNENRFIKAFYHPDYTVGPGVSPDHALLALAGFTAGRDLALIPHPAPKAT